MSDLYFYSNVPKSNNSSFMNGIGAFAQAGANIASQFLNQDFYQQNQEQAFRYQKELMNLEQDWHKSYQNWLWRQGPSAQVEGLKAAGLNPAFDGNSPTFGSSPTVSPSPPSSPYPQGSIHFDVNSALVAEKQVESMNEQIQSQKIANAKAQLELDDLQANREVYNEESRYYDPDTGNEIPQDKVDAWTKEHPGHLPEIRVVKSKGSKGRLQAKVEKGEYETLLKEQEGRASDVETRMKENEYKTVEASLQKKIANRRLNSAPYIRAMVKMAPTELRHLDTQISYLKEQIETEGLQQIWQDLQNKQFEESSLGRLIDKIKDPNMSFGEKTLSVLLMIANGFLSGNMSLPRSRTSKVIHINQSK